MNKDFLYYYNLELQHLREMGGEFAKANPKVAGRLNLNEFACEDPYVERLMEGFSYLAARVHQKLDAGYPRLSQALLDNLFPDYLMPIPSMGIAKIEPDYKESSLGKGNTIRRGTRLRSISAKDIGQCQFSTAHDVTLWPVKLTNAKYYMEDMSYLKVSYTEDSQSCICLDIDAVGESGFKDIGMDCMDFYIRSTNQQIQMDLYELMLSNCKKVIIQGRGRQNASKKVVLDNSKDKHISAKGFDLDESLFPYNGKTFEGYRLFRKYFVLPQSFMFFSLKGIREAINQFDSDKLSIVFVFDTEKLTLKNNIRQNNFSLYCVPVVNLFEKTLSRIHLNNTKSEFHVVGERREPLDYEIVKVKSVRGYKRADNVGQPFRPLYSATGFFENERFNKAYYSLNRVERTLSETEHEHGSRTNYIGTETYISLVDKDAAPYRGDLTELEIKALCSNRDLPLLIPVGTEASDFNVVSNLPISSIKFVHGPTNPSCDHIFRSLWNVINHISLNYMTLQDRTGAKTGDIIRNIMNLYAINDVQKKFIKGLKKIKIEPSTLRFAQNGMFTFLNGLGIEISFDQAVSGNDYYLLGMILDRFFEYAAPINTFTKTSVKTNKRGVIKEWQARTGTFQMM